MKVVIPHHMDYQRTVNTLVKLLNQWNLGCHVAGSNDDDAQTIVDLGDPSNAVALTDRQQKVLSTALPGIVFVS